MLFRVAAAPASPPSAGRAAACALAVGGRGSTERPSRPSPEPEPCGAGGADAGAHPLFEEVPIQQTTTATSFREIREAARQLAPLALDTLAAIMRGTGSDSARLAAAREVLDRAHGKSRARDESGEDDEEGGVTVVVRRFFDPVTGEPLD